MLWYEDLNAEEINIKEYKFTRVIFGAGPSPILLCGTLNHHLEKYPAEDPECLERLKKRLDIDDAIIGCDSVEDAVQMFQKASTRLKEATMSLKLTIQDKIEFRRLHGFGDRSKQAYYACVFQVMKKSTEAFSSLVTAKTRVAPVPRLELMAARILSTLISTVKQAF